MNLVIVESPAKAKTINKYLGKDYKVLASYGHIRDLPSKNGSVDPDNNFQMLWEIDSFSKKYLKEITDSAADSNKIILATDPDREGEAIAWHVKEVLDQKKLLKDKKIERVVFNEITKKAVTKGIENPRDIEPLLVDAYMARRALDYLVGFNISPILWTKLPGSKSAGRVQSVALKLITEREHEIELFDPKEFWTLKVNFKDNNNNIITSNISQLEGSKVEKFSFKNKEEIDDAAERIKKMKFSISDISSKTVSRNPSGPFTTSTLQQVSSGRLGLGASRTMQIAQKLYQGIEIEGETIGLITYMRTDGTNISEEAVLNFRNFIKSKYGNEYLPRDPLNYSGKKAKNAQEAHEAIRPTDIDNTPEKVKKYLSPEQHKLYDLIWKRTVASQMNSAKIEQTKLQISDEKYLFVANGKTIVFPGFLRAYVEGSDDPTTDLDDMEKTLPKVSIGDSVQWDDVMAKQHFTKPISRFTEASLVKELEALGIGRPSTYASIMKKIQDKGYVNNQKGSLVPTFVGYGIVQFLERNFNDLVNLKYTSNMEDELDNIAMGKMKKEDYLNNFYYGGDGSIGLHDKLGQEHDKPAERLIYTLNSDEKVTEIRIGRYGIYAQLGEERVTLDSDIAPSEITIEAILKMLSDKNAAPEILAKDEKTGNEIVLKKGRFGPYLKAGDKMKSLPPGVTEDSITPEIAKQVMLLPQEIGVDKKTKLPIIKDIGRYGPYLKCGKNNRKVSAPDDILSITLERAIELFSTDAKQQSILKTLGQSEDVDIVVKDGRYGIYVTNGKVNVTLPKDIDYNTLDLKTALELIKNKKPKKRFSKSK